ncbi:MAG TPA: hydrogenase maturation protease [Candidatus Limnocylindrales bacterium]|nr:hydrogenase maturation protease [Candidatus Limnocylindrales bacterium]
MTRDVRPLVAIGVGNVLLGDDAIGIRVIEALRSIADQDPLALPSGTRLVDGGTLGLDLLRVVGEARGVVLVDAVRLGAAAGSVSVFRGDAIATAGGHRDGQAASAVGELIAVARLMGWLPQSVSMVGIEVVDTEFGMHLSPVVDHALPAAMDAVMAELRRMDERPGVPTTGGIATGPMAGATA